MRLWKILAISLLLITFLPLLTYARGNASNSSGGQDKTKQVQPDGEPQNNGERKFAQNCGRCHTPPEGFSPHISGTILRHMRVRASLSKQDEKDILRFLNP